MTNLRFSQLRKILCLGAHADDIEIGCGGTLLRLLADYPGLHIYWVVLSANMLRAEEARRSAQLYFQNAAEHQFEIKTFRDSFFPYNGGEIKDFFHSLGRQFSPDLVLTHRRDDLHQDHRLVSDLTWNTFRNQLILEYEIPKYDGDLGRPNVFVTIDEPTCQRKIDGLLQGFPSQREKPWFTRDTFLSLMRIRGVECNSPSGLAEGLYCRKGVI
jgi:LmbE family N-acetylglucosaminyl deacetylase